MSQPARFAPFQWADYFETGFGEVDGQHHKLVDLVNELHTATSQGNGQSVVADLLERVQAILLRPGSAWTDIAAENHSIAHIYKSYLIFLAAIPAIAGFIGFSLVGVGAFGISVRVPLVQGLVSAVVSYVLSLVMAMVVAWVASWLAPRFGGQAQLPRAFQLIAYGATAGWLGGIFSAIPSLAMLGALAGLYSIYLIYRGVPVLMQVPQAKSVGYTAALIVCAAAAALVVGLVSSLVVPRPGGLGGLGGSGLGGLGGASVQGSGARITVPGTDIRIDTAKVEAASRRMEEANARGDTQEAGKAMGDMMSAALGGKGAAPVPPATLRALLPETLGSMPRTAVEARSGPVRQCGQGHDAAFALVAGAQNEQHVLERHHPEQRPEDQREDAQHALGVDSHAVMPGEHLLEGVERAGADVAVDHAGGGHQQTKG